MLFQTRNWAVLALVAVALLGSRPRVAQAQYFRAAPTQAAYNAGAAQGANAGFQVGVLNSPYYGPGLYQEGLGSYLSGGADVISAQGQYLIQEQDAKLKEQEVKQSRIDTRRKSFDQWMYERAVRPTLEDERERSRILNLRRARNDPPASEIWSGQALNALLLALQQMQIQGRQGASTPIDPSILQKINVTGQGTVGSLGLLRNDGQLRWPLTLRTSAFKPEVSKMDELGRKAFSQASAGQVDADTIVAMNETLDKLYAQLKRNISKVSANEYIKSKRYLNDLESTIKVLDDPNVSSYATRKWAAKGNSVGELVAEMTRQGLKFAPATPGDEAAYVALHSAMVAYYTLPPAGSAWDPMAK
jgi:hypothetical protein